MAIPADQERLYSEAQEYVIDGQEGIRHPVGMSGVRLEANVHLVTAPLPWSISLSTTLPTVSANLMARSDSDEIGCRVTVNGVVREEKSANGVNAQTFCLVKSA